MPIHHLLKFYRINIAHHNSIVLLHQFANLQAHNFSNKPSNNAVSLYLERARLIDRIRIVLRSDSQDSLVSVLNDRALDSFVVTNALKSAPSPDSALSLIESLKKIPSFNHTQNTLYALAKVLVKSKQTGKLKALIDGINSKKFKNVAKVGFMDQMKLYAAAGDLDSVLNVWHEWKTSQKSLNVESYIIIMNLCAHTGKDYEAVKTFNRMIDEGLVPNSRTYTVIIEHLVSSGKLDSALEVFNMLPLMDVKRSLKQYSVLVNAFCGDDRFDVVKSLLDKMQADGVYPTRVMLSSLQRMHDAGFVEETVELIKEMLPDKRIGNVKLCDDDVEDDEVADGVKLRPWFDPTVLASSLRFWRPDEVSALEDAKFVWTTRVVSKMIRSFGSAESAWDFYCWVGSQDGFRHDVHTMSKMLTNSAREGHVNIVKQLIFEMKSEGIRLSYTTARMAIDYLGISKNGEAAFSVFQNIKTLCGTLSKQQLLCLYSSVLKTLAKCKMESKMFDALDEMILAGILPDVQTFSSLMHHFAVLGDVKTVQRLFGMVKQSGLEPDGCMFKVLICGYCNSDRAVLAFRAFEEMKTFNVKVDGSTKRLLVKSLWKEGKFREAAEVEETCAESNDDFKVKLGGATRAADIQRVYMVYSGSFPTISGSKDLC
ncbi:pentatricopeptide repeat-containing protein At5g66631-like [Bidens hawaiensis]|uniref:pentatricopeptide repeat-containing protein At5g66631-like n=1 Tax=Bidens hawaiensis TaxID=980011 RepID=UPI004049F5BC